VTEAPAAAATDTPPCGTPGATPRGRPGAGIDGAVVGAIPLDACAAGATCAAGSSSARPATESTHVAAIKAAHNAAGLFMENS
jgi:hypothetical protein